MSLRRKLVGLLSRCFAGAPALTAPAWSETEYTAEVVRVMTCSPHPNADRLELATFELANNPGVTTSYVVVVGKGDFQPGDLAAYFSVDCLLPTSNPAFAFLKKRLDGQKDIFRLRAAKLRGVYSQGLLVPAPSGFEFGQSCAEYFGVTYRVDESEDRGPTAPSAHPKPQPFPVYTVESLKKVPNLIHDGEEVVITEKIHGTNFRFGWVRRRILGIPFGWRFVVGSHRVIKEGGDFYKEDVWTETAARKELAKATRDYRGYTFYGELYGYTYGGKAIQDLTYNREVERGPGLRIFDIKHGGEWLREFERSVVCSDCGLFEVSLLYVGEYTDGLAEQMAEGPSTVPGAEKQLREGCVVEAQNPRRKAKYVGQAYLTRRES